jgi:glutathione S-transferase
MTRTGERGPATGARGLDPPARLPYVRGVTALRLVTVPFSHFCEKARWAVDLTGRPYVEERHLPMLHWLATRRAGGGRTVPVLATDAGVLADSTAILRWADAQLRPRASLHPDDPKRRAECDALEDELDEAFGPEVRRIGYHYAFADDAVILALAESAPAWERVSLRLALPAVRTIMLRGMDIRPATVAAALDVVRRTYDRMAARLADGRPYLLGDRFSAADLTFGALGGPLVLPPEHPVPMPAALLPAELHDVVRELRAHPAGAFLLRLYAGHRVAPTRAAASA